MNYELNWLSPWSLGLRHVDLNSYYGCDAGSIPDEVEIVGQSMGSVSIQHFEIDSY